MTVWLAIDDVDIDYAHHSYGLVEQIAPQSEKILVETSMALVAEAF